MARPRRHLAQAGRDPPVLSPDAHLVVDPVPPLGPGAARLPPRQRAAPRLERRRALARARPPVRPGRLDGGGGVRAPSRARRVGGLGDGAEERAVGVLLPARAARLSALGPGGRRGAGRRAPGLRGVVPLLRLRRAQQERHLHAARRRRARPLVEARASRAGPDPRAGSARYHERGGGRADRMVGAALRGRGRAGVGAFPPRALSGGRARALVLRREARVARRPGLHLPALDARPARLVAVALPARGRVGARRPGGAPATAPARRRWWPRCTSW